MMLKDDSGQREVHNAMERAGAEVIVPVMVHGPKGVLTIFLNGQVMEERSL